MFIDLRDRERGEEWVRERERNMDWLPPIRTPTGDGTHDVGMCPDGEPALFWCTGWMLLQPAG